MNKTSSLFDRFFTPQHCLVQPATTPEKIRTIFDQFPLENEQCDEETLRHFLELYAANAVDHGSSNPACPAKYHMYGPTDELALALFSVLSTQAPEGVHQLPNLPLFEHVSDQVLNWFCTSIYGKGSSAKGVFNDSGSALNISALIVALHHSRKVYQSARHEDDVLIVSAAAHYSSDTAANVTGLGFDQVLKIQDLFDGTVDVMHLKELLDTCDQPDKHGRCKVPRMIVITVGTSVSGRIEPIKALCEYLDEYNNRHPERAPIWVHVDGCFGGPYAFLSAYSTLFAGMSQADSVGIDMHKTVPGIFTSAALFFKNPEDADFTKRLWPEGKNPYLPAALCTAAYLAKVGTDGFLEQLNTFMENAEVARDAIQKSAYLMMINEGDYKTPIVNFKYRAPIDVLVAASHTPNAAASVEAIDNLARDLMARLGLAAYNKGTVTTNGKTTMVYRPTYVNRYETHDQIKYGLAVISRVYAKFTVLIREHLRRGEPLTTFNETSVAHLTSEEILSGLPQAPYLQTSFEVPRLIEGIVAEHAAPEKPFKIQNTAQSSESLFPYLHQWMNALGPMSRDACDHPVRQGQLMSVLFKGSLAAFRSSPVESEVEARMMRHYGELLGFCDATGASSGEGAYFHNPLLVALLTGRNHLTGQTELPLNRRSRSVVLLIPDRQDVLSQQSEAVALQIGISVERIATRHVGSLEAAVAGPLDKEALKARFERAQENERFIVVASLRTENRIEDPLNGIRRLIAEFAPGKVDFHIDLSQAPTLIYSDRIQLRLCAAHPDSVTLPELVVHRDKTILAEACSPKGGSYLLEKPEDRGNFMISCGRSASEPMRDYLTTRHKGLSALKMEAESCV